MRPYFLALLTLGSGLAFCPPTRADTAPASNSVEIDGFRSARFGMNEAQVRAAIASDFNLPGNAIQSIITPIDQTEDISVSVPSAIGGLGRAGVHYIMGYRSHTLIEIIITWSEAEDRANSAEALAGTAEALQNYFLHEGFPPAATKLGIVMPNGDLLVFRGSDAAGHEVAMILSGRLARGGGPAHVRLTPTLLTVGYVQAPGHLDIYSVPKGAF